MNPFLRAHARPLLGSALLHAVAFALLAFTAWVTVTPKFTPPAAIDAYLARPPVPRAPVEPVAVKPDPVELPAPELPAAPAPLPLAAPVAPPHAPPHAPPAPQAAELVRKQAREHEAARRAAAEAKQRAQATAADKARKAVDARQREVRETDLKHQLEAEEHRLGAENAGLLGRYISELQARIERKWNRPPSAHAGLRCVVNVTQVPGGTVTDVHLGDCDGDSSVQQSIVLAVYNASPLPAPPDPSLFDRHLRLVFEPHD